MKLREMQLEDVVLVSRWLSEPHVARWWLAGSSLEREIEDLRQSVTGEQAVEVRIIVDEGRPVGWCQWYVCAGDPEWASDIGAAASDVGMDYAIGVASSTGKGLGTLVIAGMVDTIQETHPQSAIFADPDERNTPSRRVLEKNGFELLGIKPVGSEPTDDPMAIYRLGPPVSASGR